MSAELAPELAPVLECRQWWCTRGTMYAVVVAATKEDARAVAVARFNAAGRGLAGAYASVRPATVADVAAYEGGLKSAREVEVGA